MLTLLLGGARSGKSALAVQLAAAGASPTTFVATGEPLDDEMAERIARHRSERPAQWGTVEEPLEVGNALSAAGTGATVIIDCLTLWVANLLRAGHTDRQVIDGATKVAALAAGRPGHVIVISNEVGSGIVPADPLSRRYRDLLGLVNTVFAEHAGDAFLVVAGRVVPLLCLVPAVTPDATGAEGRAGNAL
jgi:adenosyl cobinamide kinase/adenosyl cobinamide phosphate guanylyltransferase